MNGNGIARISLVVCLGSETKVSTYIVCGRYTLHTSRSREKQSKPTMSFKNVESRLRRQGHGTANARLVLFSFYKFSTNSFDGRIDVGRDPVKQRLLRRP